MLKLLALPALLLATASPALAFTCNEGSGTGLHLSFGLNFSFGNGDGRITEQDRADFDLMRLRHAGVDATAVEYWQGCLRAYVRNDNGRGEHMEFYDPETLRRVDDF